MLYLHGNYISFCYYFLIVKTVYAEITSYYVVNGKLVYNLPLCMSLIILCVLYKTLRHQNMTVPFINTPTSQYTHTYTYLHIPMYTATHTYTYTHTHTPIYSCTHTPLMHKYIALIVFWAHC